MKIAVVTSRFNEMITQPLYAGCVARLEELGVVLREQDSCFVPGAIEIPLVAQHYAQKGYAAVICLGAVIRGETTHYDYVCQQVSYGCQRVALDFNIPVIFGILTTENDQQALDRIGGVHGHKGRDAADTAVQMLTLALMNNGSA